MSNSKIMKGNRVRHVRYAGLHGVVVDVVERGTERGPQMMVVVDHGAGGKHEYEPAWLVPIGGVDAEVA